MRKTIRAIKRNAAIHAKILTFFSEKAIVLNRPLLEGTTINEKDLLSISFSLNYHLHFQCLKTSFLNIVFIKAKYMPNPFELLHFIVIGGDLFGKIFSGYVREVIMYKKDYTLCKLFCTKKYTLCYSTPA
jgi:hypothetical protein